MTDSSTGHTEVVDADLSGYFDSIPHSERMKSLARRLSDRHMLHLLNRMQVGWANYFCLGPVSPAYRAIDQHVSRRLRPWLCAKHKVQGRGTARFPDEYLYQVLHLARLGPRTKTFSWAKA